MPRRFLGIRLLLFFVAINTTMMLVLVSSLTARKPWLANVIPGEWGQGHSTGLWVFFSLVLLVNALAILLAGLVMVVPALREGERGYQRLAGSLVLLVAGLFLVLAFGFVTLSFVRALPNGDLFRVIDAGAYLAAPAQPGPVANSAITGGQVRMFTVDQLARAALFDAPDVYGIHLSQLTNNPANRIFTHFTFAFRVVMGLIEFLILLAFLGRTRRAEPELGAAAPKESEAKA